MFQWRPQTWHRAFAAAIGPPAFCQGENGRKELVCRFNYGGTVACRFDPWLIITCSLTVCNMRTAASVLSSPNPSRLSTPSPARDVPPMYVSIHPRGAQPSRTDAARSWTYRTRRLQYLRHAGSLQYHAHRRALHRSALSALVSPFVR